MSSGDPKHFNRRRLPCFNHPNQNKGMLLQASYTQLLRVMRFTALLLLIGFLHVSAAGLGQNVTLSFHEVPVSTVLQEIIKQTHISIIYDKAEVNKSQL